MALQTSGDISANDINLELGESGTHTFVINNAEERGLAEKASGTIKFSDFYGKADAFDHYVEFRFTVGYKNTNLGGDQKIQVGFDAGESIGTGVDLTDGMQDKTGVNHAWWLYSCMPEKYITQGPPIGAGEYGPGETNFQTNSISIYRAASTAGAAYDWANCRIRIKNSSGTQIFTAVKTNPVNGAGDGSKYINNMLAGSTPDSADGVAEQLWLALYNVRNETVTISFEFYD